MYSTSQGNQGTTVCASLQVTYAHIHPRDAVCGHTIEARNVLHHIPSSSVLRSLMGGTSCCNNTVWSRSRTFGIQVRDQSSCRAAVSRCQEPQNEDYESRAAVCSIYEWKTKHIIITHLSAQRKGNTRAIRHAILRFK